MSGGVFVKGVWKAGQGDEFQTINPSIGEPHWRGRAASQAQVAEAVDAARQASRAWRLTPLTERIRILESYAAALADDADELAAAISQDMGKPLWEAETEIAAMQAKVAISVKAQAERAGHKLTDAPFGQTQLSHIPHGVLAVFGPFNFPGHLPNGHIVPVLLAGNTCVFKPSELAPSVADLMISAFTKSGLPAGVLNLVHGGRATGAALLNADINGVLFTGSAQTGLAFHRHFAGRPDVMLALELGGNNPIIAWEPAEVDAAADIIAQSAFLTTGQRCSCARRAILPAGAWGDAVLEGVIERAKKVRIGRWNEREVFMGPLVSARAAQAATDFQMQLAKSGGKSLRRLKRMDLGDAFVTAGVIDMTEARAVRDEELFGPLLQVYRVSSLDDAIGRAGDTRFGLAGGLVCDDDDVWDKVQQDLRVGLLNRNRPTVGASGALPFGGPGLSGNFRPGAYYAADYAAWPQASQIAPSATRLSATGFPS